jgi:hypothetical protein
MEEFKRPLLIVAAATLILIALFVSMPRPHPVAVKNTPLAPISQIEKARQAAAISDAANARLQAASAAAGQTAAP